MSVPPRGAADIHLVEDHAKEPLIACQGHLHDRLAGKHDEPHAIAGQVRQQVAHIGLGPLEAVGKNVFGGHRTRDVQKHEEVHAALLDGLGIDAESRPGSRHDHQRDPHDEQRPFDPRTRPTERRHQPLDHGRVDEGLRRRHPLAVRMDQHPRHQRQGPECQQDLRVLPIHGYGKPRKRVPARTISNKISPSPGNTRY